MGDASQETGSDGIAAITLFVDSCLLSRGIRASLEDTSTFSTLVLTDASSGERLCEAELPGSAASVLTAKLNRSEGTFTARLAMRGSLGKATLRAFFPREELPSAEDVEALVEQQPPTASAKDGCSLVSVSTYGSPVCKMQLPGRHCSPPTATLLRKRRCLEFVVPFREGIGHGRGASVEDGQAAEGLVVLESIKEEQGASDSQAVDGLTKNQLKKAKKRAKKQADAALAVEEKDAEHLASPDAAVPVCDAGELAPADRNRKKKKKGKKGANAAAVEGMEARPSEPASLLPVSNANESTSNACLPVSEVEEAAAPGVGEQNAGEGTANAHEATPATEELHTEAERTSTCLIGKAPELNGQDKGLFGLAAQRHGMSKYSEKGEDKVLEKPACTFILGPDDSMDRPEASFAAFGVFDGHGGKQAASHAAKTLLELVTEAVDTSQAKAPAQQFEVDTEEDVEAAKNVWAAQDELVARLPGAMKSAFVRCDSDVKRRLGKSGTTATLAVICGWELVVAAVGDSLAYLDTGSQIVPLTTSHRLDDSLAEQKRVQEAGSEVSQSAIDGKPVGPLRVWPGGLAMARTIGDLEAGEAVTAEPDVWQVTIPPSGGRLVVASDGLWDVINSKNSISQMRTKSAAEAVHRLQYMALSKKTSECPADDISVIIVDLLPDSGMKSPFVSTASRGAAEVEQVSLWQPLQPASSRQNKSWDRRRSAIAALEAISAANRAAAVMAEAGAVEEEQEAARADAYPAEAAGGEGKMSETYRELAELKVDPLELVEGMSDVPAGQDADGEARHKGRGQGEARGSRGRHQGRGDRGGRPSRGGRRGQRQGIAPGGLSGQGTEGVLPSSSGLSESAKAESKQAPVNVITVTRASHSEQGAVVNNGVGLYREPRPAPMGRGFRGRRGRSDRGRGNLHHENGTSLLHEGATGEGEALQADRRGRGRGQERGRGRRGGQEPGGRQTPQEHHDGWHEAEGSRSQRGGRGRALWRGRGRGRGRGRVGDQHHVDHAQHQHSQAANGGIAIPLHQMDPVVDPQKFANGRTGRQNQGAGRSGGDHSDLMLHVDDGVSGRYPSSPPPPGFSKAMLPVGTPPSRPQRAG